MGERWGERRELRRVGECERDGRMRESGGGDEWGRDERKDRVRKNEEQLNERRI